MQIPRSYLENYSKALNVVSDKARAALVDALSQIDYSTDVASIREAVIAIMQPACGASSTLAARLAADFYDGLRARFGLDDEFMAEVDAQRVPEATEGAVRAFAQDLVDGKPVEQFVGKCADRIDYETRRAANECIAYNAKNDPKKPRWARIPTGAETCQFCIMLASRGFVYHSEETASHAHAHCDCRVVPSWDKSPSVQGYNPDEYYDMWKHPEKYENREAEKQEPTIERAKLDISQYPSEFTDTKGKRQNLEVFSNAINAVDNADVSMREIYSRMNEIARSPVMPDSGFGVKYAAGNGSVNTSISRSTGNVVKLDVKVPKMTADNIGGTFRTTAHELGHFIDLLSGNNGDDWLSKQYGSFLRRDYMSLPVEERRAAARAYNESIKPKGAILEEMRKAGERYDKATESANDWYKAESKRLTDKYEASNEGDAYRTFLKDKKALRREWDRRIDVAHREAMGGIEQLQDIYDALNEGYLRGTKVDGVEMHYGHGSRYYSSKSKQVEEIWANYCSLSLTRPDLIELLRQDQPQLIESMDAMRDDILERLNG